MRRYSGKYFIVAGVVTMLLGATAQAQFGAYNPGANRAVGNGVRRGGYAAPVPVYGGSYYRSTPAEGYMYGTASLIDASGEYGKQYQEARMMNQKSEQEKIKTKMMLLDARRYEASLKPSMNEIREGQQRERLRRTMNDPPLTEILNGSALNTLLVEQKKELASRIYGPSVPLSPYVLAKINVSAPTGGGNIGIFAEGGRLNWPFPLRAQVYAEDRNKIDELARTVFTQATQNAVTPEVLNEMTKSQENLVATLNSQINDVSPGDYMTSKRFLDQLMRGITSMKSPNTANYFNGKWAARGGSVAELVANMAQEGLTFAPATRGSEAEYRSLHQSMVNYQAGIDSMLQAQRTPPPKNDKPK